MEKSDIEKCLDKINDCLTLWCGQSLDTELTDLIKAVRKDERKSVLYTIRSIVNRLT